MRTYCTQNDGDCDTCSLVSYGRDCQNTSIALYAERQEIADRERNLYSPEYFPGSAGWNKHNTALKALAAFDAEHPEIIAEIEAQRAAKAAKIADEAGWI